MKPGNQIHLLVEDLDMSTDATENQISVRLTTSSGDVVAAKTLVETGANSGEFRASIATSQRPAYAFATSSTSLSNPNDVISPDPELPAWKAEIGAIPDAEVFLATVPRFGVDTNDLIHPQTVKIALPDDQEWRQFVVETSLNKNTYVPRAAVGLDLMPWDGSPTVEMAAVDAGFKPQLMRYQNLNEYLSYGYVKNDTVSAYVQAPAPGLMLDKAAVQAVADQLKKEAGRNRPKMVLTRVRGAIYVPQRTVRTFRFEPEQAVEDFALFVNGIGGFQSALTRASGTSYIEAEVELGRGVHTVELVTFSEINKDWQGISPMSILMDTPQPPYLAQPEANYFDPRVNENLREFFVPTKQATVQKSTSGNGYTVTFPEEIDARIVRFTMLDFEGSAPSIHKVSLTEHNGTKRLPLNIIIVTC